MRQLGVKMTMILFNTDHGEADDDELSPQSAIWDDCLPNMFSYRMDYNLSGKTIWLMWFHGFDDDDRAFVGSN